MTARAIVGNGRGLSITKSKAIGKNAMEYAVKAEARDGEITILKRGFVSYEDAEDHPVKMSDWRRVWIEVIDSSNPDADRS
jgi:hypothetical protein